MSHLLFFFAIIFTLNKINKIYCESTTNDEYFVAQIELENLAGIQKSVLDILETYLSQEQIRLNEIRKRILPFIELSKTNSNEIATNPINAFLLINQLTTDLDYLISLIDYRHHSEEVKDSLYKIKRISKYPGTQDLTEAVIALARLQDTYSLDTKAMARGELGGYCCGSKLSADDCFEIGRQLYNTGNFKYAFLWMNETLRKTQEYQQGASTLKLLNFRTVVTQAEILEYLKSMTLKNKTSYITSVEHKLDLKYLRTKRNMVQYNNESPSKNFNRELRKKLLNQIYHEKLNTLCRGEGQVLQFGTTCQYVTHGNPYFVIGPVKEEIVNNQPTIYIYHDVIFESEIEIIKQMSMSELKRSNYVPKSFKFEIDRSTRRYLEKHQAADRMNKRISSITNLDLKTANLMEVFSYRVGGQYEPHYDFLKIREEAALNLKNRNNMATFLFYLNDVKAGGATVFPKLNLTIWPIKGSAAFWFNLHDDGALDYSTLHAACPVLLGRKWVSNKVIREGGQEFRWPCRLRQSDRPAP